MTTEDFKRKLTAILSADVVGYSRLMGDDEASTVKTLETYKAVMSSLIKQHRGRVVDSPGDNLLAEFGSVVDAVQCAVSIQKELQTRNADLTENRKMEFRIGINLGDVIEEEDRIYGDGVNIAARLEALADPGGICISKTAFDYIENKLPFGYSFIGEQTVKNIAKPIGAYKVLMETRLIDEEEKTKPPFWNRKTILSLGIIVILVIAGTLYWNFYPRGASISSEQEHVVPDEKEAPKSIAVLPFADHSPKEDQAKFALGLSEEIITAIDHIAGLRVTGSTSSFSSTLKNKTIQEKASELGVDHILEGNVSKDGDSIRIIIRLVRVSDGTSLWTETYNENFEEIFKIYEDIAKSVAGKLKLTIESLSILGGTCDFDAYEYYVVAKGLNYNFQGTPYDSLMQQMELLDKAIELDTEFAVAWAWKSMVHLNLANIGPSSSVTLELKDGLNAAIRALEIEPNLGKAYLSLGSARTLRGEFIEAEKAYRKGIKLTTKTIDYFEYGLIWHYLNLGYLKKSDEYLKKTRQKDPLHPFLCALYIYNLGMLGDIEQAEKEFKRGKAIFDENEWIVAHDFMSIIKLGIGDFSFIKENENSFDPSLNFVIENLDSSEQILSELHRLYADDQYKDKDIFLGLSKLASYFGDLKLALDAMEKHTIKRGIVATTDFWTPLFHEVRQLPQFKDLMKETGLVDYWKEYGWPDLCHPVGDDDFECK